MIFYTPIIANKMHLLRTYWFLFIGKNALMLHTKDIYNQPVASWRIFKHIFFCMLIQWVPLETHFGQSNPVSFIHSQTYMCQDLPCKRGCLFKNVELAADKKLNPSPQKIENSWNQNIYKENWDPNLFEGRKNLTKVARTL